MNINPAALLPGGTVNFNLLTEKSADAAPYVFTLYFIEIAYFTPAVIFYSGRGAGLLIVSLLAIAYCAQIVSLYMKNNTARRIQLVLIDLHAAFTVGYAANYISGMEGSGGLDLFLLTLRVVLLAAEFTAVAVLTSDRIISLYKA